MSFSGIDGAGKTTQIDALLTWLRDAGLRVKLFRFWDDVAAVKNLREGASHRLFKSEKGIGTPEKPVERRDKNVRAWYITAARLLLYLLDATRLRLLVAAASREDANVLIFDRYLYDELVNLDTRNKFTRAYTRLLLRLIPHPDIAFLLDADPVQARARKPEYPLDFLYSSRAAYLRLWRSLGMTTIQPLAARDVTRSILRQMPRTSTLIG